MRRDLPAWTARTPMTVETSASIRPPQQGMSPAASPAHGAGERLMGNRGAHHARQYLHPTATGRLGFAGAVGFFEVVDANQ